MSTKNNKGIELNQMARLLFDSAANNWYIGIFLQIVAGVIGVVAGLLVLDDSSKYLFAFFGFVFLSCAVFLRLISEGEYNRAETMRRQAAFTEGLGWAVSDTMMSEWRLRAGEAITDKVDSNPRNADYYASKKTISPRRLLEMTIESAFYTRHLYAFLAQWLWVLLGGSIVISFLVLSLLPSKIVSDELSLQIAYTIFLVLPILLTIDLLGAAIKLGGLKSSILEVEEDMEQLSRSERVDSEQVLRLVSEYNCHVACGLPIHNIVFKLCHNKIEKLWNKRRKK
jgi:hypothetical protein